MDQLGNKALEAQLDNQDKPALKAQLGHQVRLDPEENRENVAP